MSGISVYLVGLPYAHHSGHSGYHRFSRYIGRPLPAPVQFRFLTSDWGWRLDAWLCQLLRRPCYSVGLLLTELAAAAHMLVHRRAIYHLLYADTDLWLLGRVGRLTGNRVIASFHEGPMSLAVLGINQSLLEDVSAVLLVSESQRPFFEELIAPSMIHVVPHGIDTEFFHPAADEHTEPICITVGGHTRDYDTLAKAITLVHQADSGAKFVAVSTHIGHKGRPFADPRVEYLSGLTDEELRAAYRRSSVAVFALGWATANNSILEAMACGLPIVATDVGGVREYVGDHAALLCPPGDSRAMADAILRLLADVGLRRKLGAAGRERVLRYDFPDVAKELHCVYEAVLRAD